MVMAAIFMGSSFSDTSYVPPALSDKVLHLAAYALLGATLLHAFSDARVERVTGARVLAAILAAFVYGLSDEFHQSFVPGRTPDAMDVVADALGAATGVGVLWLTGRRFRRAQVDHAHVNRRPE